MLKPFATKLDESVLKKLDDLAHKTQIPKSRLCRQAIELLAQYYEERDKKLACADPGEPSLVTAGFGTESGRRQDL